MKVPISKDFGRLIKEALERRNWSFMDAYEATGISNTYWQNFAARGRVPSDDMLRKILRYLPEIDPVELYRAAYVADLPPDPLIAQTLILEQAPISEADRAALLEGFKAAMERQAERLRVLSTGAPAED